MKRWVGILTGLLAVAACALSVILLLTVIGWPVRDNRMQEWLHAMRTMPLALLSVLIALVIGAVGALTLYGQFFARFSQRTNATIERNARGETAIAFSALCELCERAAKQHRGVKSCRSKITAIGDEIRISVRVVTAPAESLLALTHALQEEIAAHISDVCGVQIGRIDVTVDQTEESAPEKRVR